MIGLIIAILAFPVFSAIVLERKFESTIAMSFFLIIGVQYPFYIINRVQIGFFLTCSLVILFYLLSLIAVLKNRSIQARFKNLFTHGFIIFTISSVIVWYLTRNSYVTLWDELNLWASVPKAIFSFGSLQLGPDAAVYPQMQYYPPGMSLLQYFFAKLGQGFHDEKLFFVYALFGLSLMLPAVEYCKIARIIQVPIVTVLIILLPLVYYSVGPDYDVYYKSLFIDGLIGILFAYCLFILFQFELSSTFDIFRLVLGMIALVLLKNSTILFVLSISSLFMWIKLKEKQRHDTTQCSKQHSWYVSDSKVISYERRFQFSDLLLLLPILVYFSWRLTIQHFGVNNNLAAPINFFR